MVQRPESLSTHARDLRARAVGGWALDVDTGAECGRADDRSDVLPGIRRVLEVGEALLLVRVAMVKLEGYPQYFRKALTPTTWRSDNLISKRLGASHQLVITPTN